MNNWEKLWTEIRNPECRGCSLYEDAQSVCLCGVGPIPTRLMIIGEAPGYTEDEVSKPFQGQSGKLLRSTLKEYGLSDGDIFISNAVKCRPPGNRTPDKGEVKACEWYLWEEIKAVQPQVILSLGNVSLQALTGRSGITKYHGTEQKGIMNTLVIPTFHPAAVLRNPRLTNQFKGDIRKVADMLSGNSSGEYPYVVHFANTRERLKELIEHLKVATKVTMGDLDLETTTYDYWRPETQVMCAGICVDEVHCWSIPLEHPQSPWRGQSQKIMALLKPYFEDGKWANNNWKYDQKWMISKYGIKVNYGPDQMLMGYASDENSPHDLKYQADYWCKSGRYSKDIIWPKEFNPVKDDITEKVNEFLKMDLQKLMKYNALDAFYGRHVYFHEKDRLMKDIRSARIYKHLLEKGDHIFTEIEMNGMWVDPDRLREATIECQDNIDTQLRALNSLIPAGWCESYLNKKQLKQGFNWNSTKQLGMLFFQEDGFNFPVVKYTEKGAPSTAESVLIELGSDIEHPALEGLAEYRKWSKYMSTYLKPWGAKLDENNRLHPNFKLHGTVTGRLSGEDGVHQVPRDNFIRRLIGAPPGWTFFEIDGSQIELRVVAAVAFEQTMLRVFATGGDIHRTTAAKVAGKEEGEISGPERKKAKAVNFGFVYGMGWKKFKIYAWEKYSVRLSDDEAKLFRKRFFELYKDLPEWHARMRRIVRAVGYVISPIGRRRRLPDIYSNDEGMQSAAEREAINSPVQGFGSDIVLAAFIDMILYKASKLDANWKETLQPVGAVHDAQYWLIRNDMVQFWGKAIKENFDNPDRLKKWFGYELPLPVPGDCKVGNHWGDAKDWKPGESLPFEQREPQKIVEVECPQCKQWVPTFDSYVSETQGNSIFRCSACGHVFAEFECDWRER